jgi:HK97 family phage portal protein
MTQTLAPYRKPGLLARLGQAVKAAFTFRFPSWGGNGWAWWGSQGTVEGQIDYSQEIGPVTESSLVMAAVRWVGNTLPEAPLVVRERKAGEDGKPKAEIKEGHALSELIRNPNSFYSGMTLWKGFALSWIVDGNAYLFKRRSAQGRVVELWWVPHWMIEPAWPQSGEEFITHYIYTVDGKQVEIPYEDVIHFRDGFDPLNWRKGLSPLRALQRELYGDIQSTRYTARYARNFGVPPFILSPKPDQNGVEVDTEKIKAGLMRAITGDNTGKPLVLSSAFEVKELAGRTAEVTSETNRRIPEERFASVIGIPGLVLGYGAHWGRSTFSNYEQAVEAAYEGYLLPLWRFVGAELDRQLLPEFETGKSYFVGHDLTDVRALSEDEDLLAKRVGLAYMQGVMKRGEAREKLGLKVEKGTDDIYFKEPGQNSPPVAQNGAQGVPDAATEAERRLRLVKAALNGNGAAEGVGMT